MIANTERSDRSKLVLYVGEKGTLKFTNQIVLIDYASTEDDMKKCHYPSAVESGGKLYIIETVDYAGVEPRGRGAVLLTVDLNKL